jgi:hypothetical protein
LANAEWLEVGDRVVVAEGVEGFDTWYMSPGHSGVVTAVGHGYYVLMDEDPEQTPWYFGFSEVRKVEGT